MTVSPRAFNHAQHRAVVANNRSRHLSPKRRLAPVAAQLRTQSEELHDELADLVDQGVPTVRTCWSCGCTDDRACPGGCAWAVTETPGEDLCTACRAQMAEVQ